MNKILDQFQTPVDMRWDLRHLYQNDHGNSTNSKNVAEQIRLPSTDEHNNQHIPEYAAVVHCFKNYKLFSQSESASGLKLLTCLPLELYDRQFEFSVESPSLVHRMMENQE